MGNNIIVKFDNVYKTYEIGDQKIKALNGLSLEINEGDFCVILGPSGAGKTTFLNLLGGMDYLTSGDIIVGGINISEYNSRQLTKYRRYDVGFVFQFYNLMPQLTALENVEIAKEISKSALDPLDVLNSVGLKLRVNNFPSQLSGGEQQRVSIARALCKNPKIILADEPTGALDSDTGLLIVELLKKINKEEKKTVIIVTHNKMIASYANKVFEIVNGEVVEPKTI